MTKKYIDIERSPYAIQDIPSFGLIRTNPKLSTNVRLMTNGDGLWLESFDAHETLANEAYKHFQVSQFSSYNKDLAKFYSDTDYVIPYAVGQEYSDLGMKNKYSQQYETMYWYGCEYIDSLSYSEEMGLLAPLWIGEQMPDYFVIFRIDDPSYLNMKEWLKEHDENEIMPDIDFKTDILDKCDIVKCFDLRNGKSALGTYLHNYISQDDFPMTPLEVSVDKEHESAYYGIDIVNGGFKRISEMQYSQYFETDQTILDFDSFITSGFERHRLAVANLLNIEFLFDDDKSETYKFSRYFGLYCNKVEMGSFELDWDALRCDKYVHGGERVLESPDGVYLPIVYRDGSLPVSYAGENNETVQWLKGRGCVCYADSRLLPCKVNIEDNSECGSLHLVDKIMDVANFAGFVQEDTSIAATRNVGRWDCQQIYFDIVGDIPPLVNIEIHKDGELVCAVSSEYCIIDGVPVIVPDWQDGYRFCGENTDKSKLARMVKNAFRSTGTDILEFYTYRNRVIIHTGNSAASPYSVVVTGLSDTFDIDGILKFNSTVVRDGFSYRFSQHSDNNYITIAEEDVSVFDHDGGTYIRTNNLRGYAKVTDVVQCLSNAVRNEDGVITEFDGGMKYDILLDWDDVVVEQDSVFIYKQYIPTFGVLSYFPLRDFDTYFTEDTTIYGDMSEPSLEKSIYLGDVPDEAAVESSETEVVWSALNGVESNTITLHGVLGSENEVLFDVEMTFDENIHWGFHSPDIPSEDIVVDENDEDLYHVGVTFNVSYGGGSTYESISVDDNFTYASLCGDLTSGTSKRIYNEYDRYYENYNAENCLVSKTVPYIDKWVQRYKGNNVREKAYRLTNNVAFGEFNFTPSVTTDNLDTRGFTQEWMYILDRYPYDNNVDEWWKSWSYIGFEEYDVAGGDVLEALMSTTEDNFTRILSCDCALYDDTITVDTLDYRNRWSVFSHGTDEYPSVTYFHGIGVELLEKSDYSQFIDNNLSTIRTINSGDMDGYRFSAIIVPTNDKDKWSMPLQIVRNDKYRFVCVVKYLMNGFNYVENGATRYYNIGTITRTLLYNYPSVGLSETTEQLFDTYGIGKIRVYDVDNGTYRLVGDKSVFLRDIVDIRENKIVLYRGASSYRFNVVSVESDLSVIATIEGTQVYFDNRMEYEYIIEGRRLADILKVYDDCIFSNIYHIVNTEQKGNVEYRHLDADGNVYIGTYGDSGASADGWSYCIRFLPRIINAKYNYLIPNKNLVSKSIDYVVRGNNISRMVRDNGFYEPLFKDVLYFKDAFVNEYLLDAIDDEGVEVEFLKLTRGAHTEFAYEYPSSDQSRFGTFPLLYFHRVNTSSSTQNLVSAVDKRKILPLLNSIPVGTKYNVNVFNSNFDPYYYVLTLNNIKENLIHGTANMVERKSFLGSKHLKVPDEISVGVFSYSVVSANKKVKLVDNDVVISPETNDITFSVSGDNILRKFLHEHIREEMQKWIADVFSYGDRTTTEDDIDAYIDENLLKLYKIKEISLWVKDNPSYSEHQDYSYFTKDNAEKFADGLRKVVDTTKKSYGSGGLNTRLVYGVKAKKNYCFGMDLVFERR